MTEREMNSVSENIQNLHESIACAAKAHNRDAAQVTLVAVSKKQPENRIEAALAAGQRVFGENRVQEAQSRWTDRRTDYPDLKLHLIGPLQTNKVADAVRLFDVIETLDREKLARVLSKEMRKQARNLPCFIQVNTGEEPQKSGIAPAALAEFYEFAVRECELDVTGLMCIPPLDDPPALHFGLLARYAKELELPHLSMGMSGDYEKAVALGATHIRIGSALFGPRPEPRYPVF